MLFSYNNHDGAKIHVWIQTWEKPFTSKWFFPHLNSDIFCRTRLIMSQYVVMMVTNSALLVVFGLSSPSNESNNLFIKNIEKNLCRHLSQLLKFQLRMKIVINVYSEFKRSNSKIILWYFICLGTFHCRL